MRSRSAAIVGVVLLLAAILLQEPAAFQASLQDRRTAQAEVDSAPEEPDRTQKGSVFGKVTDKSGKPVVGATVVLTDKVTEEPLSTTSRGRGLYTFGGLTAGDYTVQAEKDGLRSDNAPVEVHKGKSSRQDLVVTEVNEEE